jgi:hypothetical protein
MNMDKDMNMDMDTDSETEKETDTGTKTNMVTDKDTNKDTDMHCMYVYRATFTYIVCPNSSALTLFFKVIVHVFLAYASTLRVASSYRTF